MQRSNTYIIVYALVLTVVCAVVLSVTAVSLKPLQDANVLLETKRNILSTVMPIEEGVDINSLFDQRVSAYVIKANGSKDESFKPSDVITLSVGAEYKKPVAERNLPVFEIKGTSGETEYYVFPVFGFGLWNDIWGFIAFNKDGNTIKGVKFEHKGETPGLGARIATEEIQSRFSGKQIFGEGGQFQGVAMLKGENGGGEASISAFSSKPHEVDGMSGATITGKGLNNMLAQYLGECYQNFLKERQKSPEQLSLVQ